MNKILFLTLLIIGCYFTTFSQTNGQLQNDTLSVKFGIFNSNKTLGHFDTIDFKKLLNNPEHYKYLQVPKLADKDMHFGQLSNGKIRAPHSLDNMPCIVPQGTYPMPIYKPDSTVRYTLLIKKLK